MENLKAIQTIKIYKGEKSPKETKSAVVVIDFLDNGALVLTNDRRLEVVEYRRLRIIHDDEFVCESCFEIYNKLENPSLTCMNKDCETFPKSSLFVS